MANRPKNTVQIIICITQFQSSNIVSSPFPNLEMIVWSLISYLYSLAMPLACHTVTWIAQDQNIVTSCQTPTSSSSVYCNLPTHELWCFGNISKVKIWIMFYMILRSSSPPLYIDFVSWSWPWSWNCQL